jgi:hypothetical protein
MNLSPELLRDLSQAFYSFGDGFFRLGDIAMGLAEGKEESTGTFVNPVENTATDDSTTGCMCECETCATTSSCCTGDYETGVDWSDEENDEELEDDDWNEDDSQKSIRRMFYVDWDDEESNDEEDDEYLEDVDAEFDEDWEV